MIEILTTLPFYKKALSFAAVHVAMRLPSRYVSRCHCTLNVILKFCYKFLAETMAEDSYF